MRFNRDVNLLKIGKAVGAVVAAFVGFVSKVSEHIAAQTFVCGAVVNHTAKAVFLALLELLVLLICHLRDYSALRKTSICGSCRRKETCHDSDER